VAVVATGGAAAAVLIPALIGAVSSAGISVATQYATTGHVKWEDVAVEGAIGGAIGALTAGAGQATNAARGARAAQAIEEATTSVGTSLADGAVEGGVSVATGAGGESAAMSTVRTVQRGEKIVDLVQEGKALAFRSGNEHALVKLANGERAIVSGGPGGINLSEEVAKVFAHSHPYHLPISGPSPADFNMLRALGQRTSWLLEHGDITKFGLS
jgi:hypothetical protein